MEMTRNIRLVLAYEGSEFHGWQKQPGLRTVQGTVEKCVRRVVRHHVEIVGTGRTDAGVHALGQQCNFLTGCPIPLGNLIRAIGSRLSKDVSIRRGSEVPMAFNARKHARAKCYRYRVYNAPGRPVEELLSRFCYHFWEPLDTDPMQQAARTFVGQHDFSAMASRGSPRKHNVRTVLGVQCYRHGNEVRIDVVGRGFLYNQVRNMAGTLIEVGRGHWPPERVAEIMASHDRSNAGPTAPARGLTMMWVRYDARHLIVNPEAEKEEEEEEQEEENHDAETQRRREE